MKLIDLIEKLDEIEIVFINGKHYDGNLSQDILQKKITKINLETIDASSNSLESLGYSFEVGM